MCMNDFINLLKAVKRKKLQLLKKKKWTVLYSERNRIMKKVKWYDLKLKNIKCCRVFLISWLILTKHLKLIIIIYKFRLTEA